MISVDPIGTKPKSNWDSVRIYDSSELNRGHSKPHKIECFTMVEAFFPLPQWNGWVDSHHRLTNKLISFLLNLGDISRLPSQRGPKWGSKFLLHETWFSSWERTLNLILKCISEILIWFANGLDYTMSRLLDNWVTCNVVTLTAQTLWIFRKKHALVLVAPLWWLEELIFFPFRLEPKLSYPNYSTWIASKVLSLSKWSSNLEVARSNDLLCCFIS